jgi:3-phytase
VCGLKKGLGPSGDDQSAGNAKTVDRGREPVYCNGMSRRTRITTGVSIAFALLAAASLTIGAQKRSDASSSSKKRTAVDLELRSTSEAAPVPGDADDCAIWVRPGNPGYAVIIGTDKKASPGPGLHVWTIDGHEIQFVPVARPNNVDVRRGVRLGGRSIDVAVCNARGTHEMRVFSIDRQTGMLTDITTAHGIRTPELEDPYGVCLYHRPRDGALFVITSSEKGDTGRLHQYRLEDDGSGHVRGTHVRTIGDGTILRYVEGLVADDELGWVYASDEDYAVRKYHADPDSSSAQVTSFATDNVTGDREGLTIYDCGGGRGWILLSSQGDGTVKVYRRQGEPGDPQQHPLVATLGTRGSRSTDGLDVTSFACEGFPAGFLAKHDSKGRNFVLYSWEDALPLLPCPRSSR